MSETPVAIHHQTWGEGPPVLALHGLGLESSSFTGLADRVVGLGLSMMAADLPGFGLTPAPDAPLTAPRLAEPVVDLVEGMDPKPLVMGMSLGARVALEVALVAPEHVRGLVMMAPPLPRLDHRWALHGARLLSPWIAQRIPVEWAWPWLKERADHLEQQLTGEARHDWFLRSSRRTIYYISCPATRRALVSAARELALDPAHGPDGVWTRLPELSVPAAFVWGGKDRLVDMSHIDDLVEMVPDAVQIHVPCAGHFDNGSHFRCLEEAAIEGIRRVDPAVRRGGRPSAAGGEVVMGCVVEHEEGGPRSAPDRRRAS